MTGFLVVKKLRLQVRQTSGPALEALGAISKTTFYQGAYKLPVAIAQSLSSTHRTAGRYNGNRHHDSQVAARIMPTLC